MAYFKIEFFSNSLRRFVNFDMYIPNDIKYDEPRENKYQHRETKTLFLLHGYTGSANNWGIDELAKKYNFAMVMPNGENAFWLNQTATGHKYCSYVGEELIEYIRKTFGLCKNAEDTYVCGISMGGFGALHTGFYYPNTFSKIAAMSPALILHDIAGMKPEQDDGVANYEYYKNCFGDLENVLESKSNPETLVKELKAESRKIPQIYMCCGTEDFLIENCRNFHKFLDGENVPNVFLESKGEHNSIFWNEYIVKVVEWMFEGYI